MSMAVPRAVDAAAGGLAAPAAVPLLSRFVDACLFVLLAAVPLIAPSADRATVVMLAGAAALGVWSLYQKASRAQRVSRCAWVIFLAAAVAVHLGARELDPATGAAGSLFRAAVAARLAVVLALVGRLGVFAWQRRYPRLVDAHDWAAVLCLGILALTAGAFITVGEARGARALAEPAAIAAMLLVIRGQCGAAGKARRLARLATASAVLSLVVWGVTR